MEIPWLSFGTVRSWYKHDNEPPWHSTSKTQADTSSSSWEGKAAKWIHNSKDQRAWKSGTNEYAVWDNFDHLPKPPPPPAFSAFPAVQPSTLPGPSHAAFSELGYVAGFAAAPVPQVDRAGDQRRAIRPTMAQARSSSIGRSKS